MTQTKIKGVLKTWKADRGFGFIKPDAGGQDIFIHISSLKNVDRRPVRGDVIYYQIAKDNQGKYKASNATIEGAELLLNNAGDSFRFNKWLTASALALLMIAIMGVYFYGKYK